MREETEWVETVNFGANILTGANTQAILDAYERYKDFDSSSLKLDSFKPYGDGTAAHKIVRLMESIL
jgi:UDP-GlcNAc3NAcA epimerase